SANNTRIFICFSFFATVIGALFPKLASVFDFEPYPKARRRTRSGRWTFGRFQMPTVLPDALSGSIRTDDGCYAAQPVSAAECPQRVQVVMFSFLSRDK